MRLAVPLSTMRWDRTIHMLTDTHLGAVSSLRPAEIIGDIQYALKAPVLRLINGDCTNEDAGSGSVNTAAYDALAVTFHNQLAAADGAPLYINTGNHDVFGGTRTGAQYLAGMATGNVGWAPPAGPDTCQTIDTAFCRVIIIGDDLAYNVALKQSTLDYLDAALAGTSKPCLIFSHFPLKGVVGSINSADPTNCPDASTNANYWVKRTGDLDDVYIRNILAARTNAKGWFCGHAHPHPSYTPNAVTTLTIGGRRFCHVMGGAGYYTHPFVDAIKDGVWGTYITWLDGKFEIRCRNHQGRQFVPINGVATGTVATITVD